MSRGRFPIALRPIPHRRSRTRGVDSPDPRLDPRAVLHSAHEAATPLHPQISDLSMLVLNCQGKVPNDQAGCVPVSMIIGPKLTRSGKAGGQTGGDGEITCGVAKGLTMRRLGRSRRLVLVLEVDSPLRKRAVDMLEQGGFEVLEAESAAATLLYLEARGDDVVAVFTELNLFDPVGEPSLIQSIRQRWPHIRHFRRDVDPKNDPVMSERGDD